MGVWVLFIMNFLNFEYDLNAVLNQHCVILVVASPRFPRGKMLVNAFPS
ncbi:hypothetical protein WKT22_01181 [Candidatus Lokiarchaeum ossiferum]